MTQDERRFEIVERPTVSALGMVLGFGPMLPFVLGAVAGWRLEGEERDVAIRLTVLWGAAILLFLAGVRRGLSFRTPSGPRLSQIATVLGLFLLGFGALLAEWLDFVAAALMLETAGFTCLVVLDPVAARMGEAPLFFRRLRPLQLPIAVASLGALLWLLRTMHTA